MRCDDEELQQVLLTAIKNLYQAIAPVKQAGWGQGPLSQLDQSNSSQSRLSVTSHNHCVKDVDLLPVDPNNLWQVLVWIRQLGVMRQWQWYCVFVVYCRDSCNVLLFQIFSWWTWWCNKKLMSENVHEYLNFNGLKLDKLTGRLFLK